VSALACLLISAGLSQLTASPAAAVAPTNLQPSTGTPVSGIPALTWDRSSDTAKYDVQISASSSFSSTIDSVTATVNDQWVPDTQLPSGPLYWRIRVNGSGDPWTTADFVRSDVAAPVVTGPSDGASLEQPEEAPVLSWEPVPGADSYQVQYGTDPNFVDQTTTKTTDSSSYVVDLQAPGDYDWRVRGVLATGFYTTWSAGRSYTIEGLGLPVLQSPDNDENENLQDVVLDWEPVSGAKSYDLQISTDVNFLTFDEKDGILGTRYSPPQTLNNDQYYWRVRPVDAANNKPEWGSATTWQFRRNWPSQPTLEYPGNGATVGDPFYYQWTPTQLASEYSLEVSPNPTFTPASSVETCTTVHTTLARGDQSEDQDCFPDALGTYYWRVKGSDEFSSEAPVTDVIVAQVRSFTYVPGHVTQTSPSNGATVSVPTLRWDPQSGAATYRVTITDTSDSSSQTFETAATSYTPRSLDQGTYRWDVRTVSEHGDLGWGYLLPGQPTFTVGPPPAGVGSFPNPSPVDAGSSYRFPTLTWTPVTGAEHYELRVRRSGTIGWLGVNGNFEFPAGEDTGTNFIAPGDYQWYVEAYNDSGGLISAGGIGTFTILQLPAVSVSAYRAAITGNTLTGNGGTTDVCDASLPASCQNLRQTPVLGWTSPDPNVGYYELYLSHDSELTNLYFTREVDSTMWSKPGALADSQAGSAYFWLVVPCTADGNCSPLTHADHAFNKQSRQLTVLSPADGATVQNDVTFTWDDYLTSQAVVDGADPDTGTPLDTPARTEAREYRIQTSTDPNFVTGVTTTSVDQRTFTSFADTYPEGTTYWRVQAVDGSGNLLAWSTPRSFVKQSPSPVLSLPAADATVPGDSTLSWQPLDFAASYVVEVYKNNDMVPNAANRVVNATTNRVSYVLDTLDPAQGPYTWRVERKDAKGRPGAWSALRSFSVTAPAPPLLLPEADATVEPSDGLFTWGPLGGATKYRFERRIVGTSSSTETVTTAALAYAPTAAIAGGSWEWRVTGIDTAGHNLGSSAWRPFAVVDTPVATTPVSITGSGAVGTPLTLNPPTWNMPAGTVTTTYQWYAGTSAISGETGATYNVTSANVGKAITVKATGTRPGYKTGTSTSNAITAVNGPAIVATSLPEISGIAAARETLTATSGTWPGSPTYAYQWFVNGIAVAKETKNTYVVRTRDAGLPVNVRVTATTSGYQPGTAFSNAMTVAKLSSTVTATLAKKKITQRQRAQLTVKVSMLGYDVTLGKIQVKDGSKVIATVALQAGKDTVTIRLKKLKRGKHKLKVSYLGSVSTLGSSAKPVTLKVIRNT
jgi:large repetitive protein